MSDWISVKDRLPSSWVPVRVWDKPWNTSYDACYNDEDDCWEPLGDREPPDNVTHWMPLPEPPE